MPNEPETIGLLALMLLHDSRRDARVNAAGELVVLEEQDRSLWHRRQIDEGLKLVDQALRLGRAGPYQVQAAIAAVHAGAKTADETDWKQIAALYRELASKDGSPVVYLNHAVAVAMSDGIDKGLALIEELGSSGGLESYHLYHAARADLLRRTGRWNSARQAYEQALSLTSNAVERRYLRRRIAELHNRSASWSDASK